MRAAGAANAPRLRSAWTENHIACTAGGKRTSAAAMCRHGACEAHSPGRRSGALRLQREGAVRRPYSAAHAGGGRCTGVVDAFCSHGACTTERRGEVGERGHSSLQARRRRRASALSAGGFAAPARCMHREGAVNAGRRRRKSGRMRRAGGARVRRLAVHAIRLAGTPLRQRSNAQRLRRAGARHGP